MGLKESVRGTINGIKERFKLPNQVGIIAYEDWSKDGNRIISVYHYRAWAADVVKRHYIRNYIFRDDAQEEMQIKDFVVFPPFSRPEKYQETELIEMGVNTEIIKQHFQEWQTMQEELYKRRRSPYDF